RFKYALRLAIFAVISELPFDIGLMGGIYKPDHNNVFFTLLIGLLMIWLMETVKEKLNGEKQILAVIIYALTVAAACGTAYFIKSDYIHVGVLTIACFYVLRLKREWSTTAAVSCLTLLGSSLEAFAFADVFILKVYNGQRGRNLKFFFYIFYPAHLLLIGLIAHFCFKPV
nr:conjugal transfer protein TraX [Lachnospiraceae bacterium]